MDETPADQIKREIEDPDAPCVGPYRKDPDEYDHIEAIVWASGQQVNSEGYVEPLSGNSGE